MERQALTGLATAAAIAVTTLLAAADPAVAASAGVIGNELRYVAGDAEQNDALIRVEGDNFIIEERGPGVPLEDGPNCPVQDGRAVCPMAGVTEVKPRLGDGDDAVVIEVALPSIVEAGAGNDRITGGPRSDTILGGDGQDAVVYAARVEGVSVTLDGIADDGAPGEGDNAGTDVENVIGSVGNDLLAGNAAANGLAGGPGTDTLMGGDGPDALDGGGGDDRLDGGEGADTIGGGDGTDTVSYAGVLTGPVRITLDGASDDGPLGAEPDTILGDVENALGSGQDDDVTGGDGDNALDAGAGEDLVDGSGGVDALAGGDDPDVVRARDGGADAVDCGSGRDLAITDPGDTVQGCEHVAFRGRAPRAGSNIVVAPVRPSAAQVKGAPLVSPRGMRRLVPLQDRISVPVRSRVDVSSGIVSLTAATGRGKRVQRGRFAPTLSGRPDRRGVGSEVLMSQSRGRGFVVGLTLKGGSFRNCRVRASADKAQRRRGGTRRSRRVVRRVWGRARGRFRTRGRFSAATVRGTTWAVEDRCDGTLTRVRRGRVTVTDTVRRRVVTLRAGDSYLATPRGTRPRLDRKGR